MRYVALMQLERDQNGLKIKIFMEVSEKPRLLTIEACLKSEKIQRVIFSLGDTRILGWLKKLFRQKASPG